MDERSHIRIQCIASQLPSCKAVLANLGHANSMQTIPLHPLAICTITVDSLDRAGTSLVEIVPVTTVTVPPYTTTNAVFFGFRSFWVIDPGTPYDDQRGLLASYINRRLDQGHKFLGVCLTHHHGDHSKAAEFLAQLFSVPIIAHHASAAFLKFPFHPIVDGEVISHAAEPNLIAIHTPGHADDHIVYYQPDMGILVAGDMITDRGTILVPPVGGSLSVYLESLDALSQLTLSAIVPAHGKIISEEPNAFLIRAMKHRYDRIQAIFAAIKEHSKTLDATDITHLVYGDSIPDNVFVFAQLSVESSLHWLKDKGLLENYQHAWRVAKDSSTRERIELLERLEEIEQRLRNT